MSLFSALSAPALIQTLIDKKIIAPGMEEMALDALKDTAQQAEVWAASLIDTLAAKYQIAAVLENSKVVLRIESKGQ